jgi:hypothetical protein
VKSPPQKDTNKSNEKLPVSVATTTTTTTTTTTATEKQTVKPQEKSTPHVPEKSSIFDLTDEEGDIFSLLSGSKPNVLTSKCMSIMYIFRLDC